MPRSAATVTRAKAARYARIRATTGCTALAAWREITRGWQKMPTQSQYNQSSEWSHNPVVIEELNKAVDSLQVQEIDTVTRWHLHTISREEEAVLANNWNAAQAFNRQRGQSLGALTERLFVQHDHSIEASKLVAQLKSLGVPAELADALMPRTSFDPAPLQIEDNSDG